MAEVRFAPASFIVSSSERDPLGALLRSAIVAPSGVRKRLYPAPWARNFTLGSDCPTFGSKIMGKWLKAASSCVRDAGEGSGLWNGLENSARSFGTDWCGWKL